MQVIEECTARSRYRLWGLCASAGIAVISSVSARADPNSFLGNTLQAQFTTESQTCSRKTGECTRGTSTDWNINVYFGSQGSVFDYEGDSSGIVSRAGQARQTGGSQQRWQVSGATAVQTTSSRDGTLRVTFRLTGGRCTATVSFVFTDRDRYAQPHTRSCRVIAGRVER